MSILTDLINQIDDANLKERISKEVDKLAKQKKFGLVFEEHQPECTPLYEMPIKVGSHVAKKDVRITDVYTVIRINGNEVECVHKETKEVSCFSIDDMVVVAEFGEPIYPYLKPIDGICNAPDSDLWHTLIEADNYHALQLLEYLYAGKVDCIYIDPPYNSGARDWKYNNDYVDGNDQYRHSKWLSMMQKRLKIAKKLLNPVDSVLIVTIDEKEYLHLGCLLEEMFPEAKIQMISTVINAGGSVRVGEFSRMDEYIFFVMIGKSHVLPLPLNSEWRGGKQQNDGPVLWRSMLRGGEASSRMDRPNMFYPVLIKKETCEVIGIGESLPLGEDRNNCKPPQGVEFVWPIRKDGTEGRWRVGVQTSKDNLKNGYIKANRIGQRLTISYLASGVVNAIEEGGITVSGNGEDMSFQIVNAHKIIAGTVWQIASHDASKNGTSFNKLILCGNRFSFPKSLYAVHDTIRFFVANKPNALIVDFFAGSGTTMHAVNLLNAEDGGHRRCIMVTNNEVSEAEAKDLKAKGFKPGDPEWEKLGIAHYVTWPRTVCSIKGKNIKGEPLKGNYIGSDIPMADGFKANAAFFKLGFLDKNSVALGRQFKELLPILWMKAGAIGACPSIDGSLPDYLICKENKMAVLINENAYMEFAEQIDEAIDTVYIITDSDAGYREMIKDLNVKNTYQLYRDYLDNFRINSVRR